MAEPEQSYKIYMIKDKNGKKFIAGTIDGSILADGLYRFFHIIFWINIFLFLDEVVF